MVDVGRVADVVSRRGRAAGLGYQRLLFTGLDAVQCSAARWIGPSVRFAKLLGDGGAPLMSAPVFSLDIQLSSALPVGQQLKAGQKIRRGGSVEKTKDKTNGFLLF